MKALYIGYKDVLTTLRDYKALAILILMPLILILVLGAALGPIFNGSGINKFDIALVDNDNGQMSKMFREKVLDNKDVKKLVGYKEMSEDKARQMIKDGKVSAGIIIPKDFSQDFYKGVNSQLTVLKSPSSELRGAITEQLAKSFTGVASSTKISVNEVMTRLTAKGVDHRKASAVIPDVINKLAIVTDFREKTEKSSVVGALPYYSVAMLAMYLLFTSGAGNKTIVTEREEHTLMRLLSADVSKLSIIAGKFIGVMFLAILQQVVMIVFTKYAYGVYWGDSILGLFLMIVASAMAISGLSVLVASFSKTSGTGEAISNIIVFSMSAIGGSFMPIYVFGKSMKMISNFTVNKWVLNGFLALMNQKGISDIMINILVLAGMGICMLVIGSMRLRFE